MPMGKSQRGGGAALRQPRVSNAPGVWQQQKERLGMAAHRGKQQRSRTV